MAPHPGAGIVSHAGPRLNLTLLVTLLAGCPGTRTTEGPRVDRDLPDEVERALRLPPDRGAQSALARIEALTLRGSCAAAWLRARYLIDLFDGVRLAPPESTGPWRGAHAALWRALHLPGAPGRGRLATEQVFDNLRAALQLVPAGCAERAHVAVARQLMSSDVAPRRRRADALAVVVAYKRIARSSSPLAINAQLRLLDWCDKAFHLAAGGAPALQQQRINQCLFPLFDADPSPYLDADAAQRPPDPPWPLLAQTLLRELAALRASRLGSIAKLLHDNATSFFAQALPLLPTPLDATRSPLPESAAGEPWDRTPLVQIKERGYLVGGRAVLEDDAAELERAIAARLRDDRRGRVAVAAAASSDASRVGVVARAARRAGGSVLELGVARVVARRPPAGDVLATIAGGRPIRRLEVIPLSLALFSSPAPGATARERPAGQGYDAGGAENGVAALVQRRAVRVSSRDGVLAPLPASRLTAALRRLRAAYPDDTSLVVATERHARYDELVSAVVALRADAQGRPLFPGVALATTGMITPPEGDLETVLQLLARAEVTVTPESPALLAALGRCYRESLRARPDPPPAGTLVVKIGAKPRVMGGTLRDAGIRRCVTTSLATVPEGVRKLRASFRILPAPAAP